MTRHSNDQQQPVKQFWVLVVLPTNAKEKPKGNGIFCNVKRY